MCVGLEAGARGFLGGSKASNRATDCGSVAPGFERVQEAFSATLHGPGSKGVGAALCVYVDGEKTVDLWGGEAEPGIPWKPDTLVCGFSAAKGVTALAVQILADRGELDIDAPVAKVWPEFSARRKGAVTTRMVLNHSGALPWFPAYAQVVSLDEPESFQRYDKITTCLAEAPPVWEPGAKSGYHSFTYGWILAEIVRRVTGRSIGVFIRDEISNSLGASDYWIGLPKSERKRVAHILPDQAMDSDEIWTMMNPGTPTGRGFMLGPNKRLGTAIKETFNDSEFVVAEQAAINPVTDARSLARIYAMLSCGGELDGVRFVSKRSIEEFTSETFYGPDAIWPNPMRIGLGYLRPCAGWFSMGPNDEAFGHAGIGGATAFADPVRRIGFCFLPNQLVMSLQTDARAQVLIDSVYSSMSQRSQPPGGELRPGAGIARDVRVRPSGPPRAQGEDHVRLAGEASAPCALPASESPS